MLGELDSEFDDLDLTIDESAAETPTTTEPTDDDLDLSLGLDDPFEEDDLGLELDADETPASEATTEESEAAADELGLDDDLFDDLEDPFAEEEIPEAPAEEDDFGLDLELDDDLGEELLADDNSEEVDSDLGLEEVLDEMGEDDDADLDALLSEEEETPEADDGDTDDDLGLDDLFDESEDESDDALFDDPFEEAAPEIAEALAEEDSDEGDDLLLSDEDSLFHDSSFEEAEDTEISSEGEAAEAEPEAEAEIGLGNEGEEDFAFETFEEPSEITSDEPVDDDVADLLFESEEETDDAVADLTEDELPPEIDFGSTEDLGEFIDVSIMKKKMPTQKPAASAPAEEESEVSSPFDLGDDSELLSNADDDDISLGELFDSNEEEDFDFAAIDEFWFS